MFFFLLTGHLALANAAQAQFLPITEVVNGQIESTEHFIANGLADSFDGYGAIFNYGQIEFVRQVNTVQQIRSYRFLDIFTNTTDTRLTSDVFILGNLGSDYWTYIVYEGPLQALTFQDTNPPFDTPEGDFDAVIAFTTGNNQYASDFVSTDVFTNGVTTTIQLDLEPGESVGILHYATMIKSEGKTRDFDVGFAEFQSDMLVETPYTVGLTTSQLQSITNFDVVLRGDVNCDGEVDLSDISPFVEVLSSGEFDEKADTNQDGTVDLEDIQWFIFALAN